MANDIMENIKAPLPLVTDTPTEEMWRAADQALADNLGRSNIRAVTEAYSAMIAAAPKQRTPLEVARIIEPELFSYDPEVARRAAAPSNVTLLRAEKIAELTDIMNLMNRMELDK